MDKILDYFSFNDKTNDATRELIYKHWLSDLNYKKHWEKRINIFFDINNRIITKEGFVIYSLWYNGFKDYILKLQRSLKELGETKFVIIEKENSYNPTPIKLKLEFKIDDDFNKLFVDGEGLYTYLQSYNSIFLVVGETCDWGEVIEFEDIDELIAPSEYIDVFKKHFTK